MENDDYHLHIPGMILVGWVIVGQDNLPIRPSTMKRWYDDKPSAGPAKIYATQKVASRYGKAEPVYIADPEIEG